MNFYMVNEHLDAQIKEIQQRIKLSMSGVTSDSMKEKGLDYKINYGVSLPVLRTIAQNYEPSIDLSNRLWLLGWRETQLLSILLYPVDQLTKEHAIERIRTVKQKELIDVYCLFLLNKLPNCTQLVVQLLQDENRICSITAFMLAARIYQLFNDAEVDLILQKGVDLSLIDDFELYKSIAICFGRFCRINKDRSEQLNQLADEFLKAKLPSQVAVANEVKQELDFLIEL